MEALADCHCTAVTFRFLRVECKNIQTIKCLNYTDFTNKL